MVRHLRGQTESPRLFTSPRWHLPHATGPIGAKNSLHHLFRMPFGVSKPETMFPPHYILVTSMLLKSGFSPHLTIKDVSVVQLASDPSLPGTTLIFQIGLQIDWSPSMGDGARIERGSWGSNSNMFMSWILAPQTHMSRGNNFCCLWLSAITIPSIFYSFDIFFLFFMSSEQQSPSGHKSEIVSILLFLTKPRILVLMKLCQHSFWFPYRTNHQQDSCLWG